MISSLNIGLLNSQQTPYGTKMIPLVQERAFWSYPDITISLNRTFQENEISHEEVGYGFKNTEENVQTVSQFHKMKPR